MGTNKTETAFQRAGRELEESRRAENLRRYGNADITPEEIRHHNEIEAARSMQKWREETGIKGGFSLNKAPSGGRL